jgi:hypothetical protein
MFILLSFLMGGEITKRPEWKFRLYLEECILSRKAGPERRGEGLRLPAPLLHRCTLRASSPA